MVLLFVLIFPLVKPEFLDEYPLFEFLSLYPFLEAHPFKDILHKIV